MEEKILVVDDEQVVCDALKKFLAKKGYKASTALSGEEGIKTFFLILRFFPTNVLSFIFFFTSFY